MGESQNENCCANPKFLRLKDKDLLGKACANAVAWGKSRLLDD
jgi:hypothetical protein